MTDAANASTLPPPPSFLPLPTQCSCCGAVLTAEEWARLPYVGMQDDFEGGWLELRNHACLSTIARPVTPGGEHRRDDGDEAMGEERAERNAEWSERSW